MTKQKTPTQLIDRATKAHEQAIRSLAAYHRTGAGTTTAARHYQRYEKSMETFDAAMAELKKSLHP